MKKKTLPQIVNDVFVLLEPLESDDRQKVVRSVMTLLGEESKPSHGADNVFEPSDGDNTLGAKATRWMEQNAISMDMIEEIFHFDGSEVELIASEVPGSGKKGKSQNCYLLAGARSLLATDVASFADVDAINLCKQMGCHDMKNHSRIRKDLGNIVAGTKNGSFTLPAPGLRAAADLVKEMS